MCRGVFDCPNLPLAIGLESFRDWLCDVLPVTGLIIGEHAQTCVFNQGAHLRIANPLVPRRVWPFSLQFDKRVQLKGARGTFNPALHTRVWVKNVALPAAHWGANAQVLELLLGRVPKSPNGTTAII